MHASKEVDSGHNGSGHFYHTVDLEHQPSYSLRLPVNLEAPVMQPGYTARSGFFGSRCWAEAFQDTPYGSWNGHAFVLLHCRIALQRLTANAAASWLSWLQWQQGLAQAD